MGRNDKDDLLEAVGYKTVDPGQIIDKLDVGEDKEDKISLDELKKPRSGSSSDKGVKVRGMGNLMVRMAKCCNPVPGDNIVGYITRGRVFLFIEETVPI